MFILIASIIFCGLPLILLYVHLKWAKEDLKLGIPGPPCIPILGNLHLLWNYIKEEKLHEIILDLINEYGETIRVRVGPKLFIFTTEVKLVEAIVNNPKFMKSDDYKIYQPWLGDGLILAHGEKWHKMRKLLTPAFHFQILGRFVPIFQEQAEVFVEKVRNLGPEENINVAPWLQSFALDVVSESSMGVKLNAQNDPNRDFVVASKELLDTLCLRFYYPLYNIDFIWKLTSHYKKCCDRIRFINGFVNDVINQRREKLLNEKSPDPSEEKPALLDILLQSTIDDSPLSNEAIRDEMNTFMVAGHETTGTTMGFVIFLLAKHQEVQEKVFLEIKENSLNQKLSIRDINSLRYLDCVIKETLRLYPILPDAIKQSAEDFTLRKYFIPAKTSILTSIHAVHRLEKNFKNPDEFNPDRFLDEISNEERSPYTYQPFSAGLRNCIGQRFAMLEMKTLLIQVLSEYKIHLGTKNFEIDLRESTLLFSRNGVNVKFEKRKK
ncbi:cytochrome P450 4d2-like [Culicoides brevitarsis]|uniref:cytochrome P450 4d2-like n=1 Tax=Culicoides brevitarsis TaxID=469753 RepID=UPI00307CBFE2